MARKLKLILKASIGTINMFYAFVDNKKVIAETGDKTATWSGDVPENSTVIKTRVTGINDAKYTLSIDLQDTLDNQKLEIQLEGGYNEISITA